VKLADALGQQFVADPRPGANGNIAAEIIARAPADGYTLMFGNSSLPISVSLYDKLNFDVTKDFTPVSLAAMTPSVLVVHPSLPIRSIKDLIALAKKQPNKLNYASGGVGNTMHLAAALLDTMAGIQMTHVPYKGAGPAIVDVIAGQCDMVFVNIAPVLGDKTGLEDFFAWMRGNFEPQLNWHDLEWIRAEWQGPIVLKGVLDVEDAREAAAQGVDGIIVSNHGGRQLDGVPSTAQALPLIADAVGDQLTVLADGGVRSGLDVLRLLALGARGVLLGRAWVWALAAGGQPAVERMLALLAAELRVAMALTGTRCIADIDGRVLISKNVELLGE
jgi:hypothetical protein